jgi:hypothetical protein
VSVCKTRYQPLVDVLPTSEHVEVRCEDYELDEVIVRRPESVHFEKLDNGEWWCGISLGDQLLHIKIRGEIVKVEDAGSPPEES